MVCQQIAVARAAATHGVVFELTVVTPTARFVLLHVAVLSAVTAHSSKSKKDQTPKAGSLTAATKANSTEEGYRLPLLVHYPNGSVAGNFAGSRSEQVWTKTPPCSGADVFPIAWAEFESRHKSVNSREMLRIPSD